MEEKKTIAIFDFDGTITRKDSFVEFIRFCFEGKLFWKMLPLAPKLLLYKLTLYSNDRMKEDILSRLFRGMKTTEFEKLCSDFAENVIPVFCKASAMERINWHSGSNHKMILLSASFEDYLKPWGEKFGFTVVSTRVEKQNGKITGKFIGKNCNFEEKLIRLKAAVDLTEFGEVFVFGDSVGDFAFMAKGTRKYLITSFR